MHNHDNNISISIGNSDSDSVRSETEKKTRVETSDCVFVELNVFPLGIMMRVNLNWLARVYVPYRQNDDSLNENGRSIHR